VQSYLSPSSENSLITGFLDEYIGEAHASNLLQMESSGLVHMIRNNRIPDLTLLFTLFQRRQKSFDLLKRCFSDFIVTEGSKLVSDTNLKTEDFIQ
jgi:cullin 3